MQPENPVRRFRTICVDSTPENAKNSPLKQNFNELFLVFIRVFRPEQEFIVNIDGIFFFLPSPRALLQGLCVTYLCCLISLSRISTIAFRFFLSVFLGRARFSVPSPVYLRGWKLRLKWVNFHACRIDLHLSTKHS